MTYHPVSKPSDLWGVAHPVVPLGLLNLKTSPGLFSRLIVVYGLDRRFFMEFATVPLEVLPDLAHWTQATSDRVGMPLGRRDLVVTMFS